MFNEFLTTENIDLDPKNVTQSRFIGNLLEIPFLGNQYAN